MAVLDLDRLSVRSEGGSSVIDVNLTVEPSELVALIGPPGSGKTTLTRAVTGSLLPDRGTITLLGVDVTRHGLNERIGAGIAHTVDSTGMDSTMTVREHLMGASDRPGESGKVARFLRPRDGPKRSVAEIIEVLGLHEDADRQLGTLRLLARRRFEVALAITGEPALVVVDGLLQGLNPEDALAVARLCRAAHVLRGAAFLVTDRRPDALIEVSRYVYVLSGGRILVAGTPAEVGSRPDVGALFAASAGPFVPPDGVGPRDVNGRLVQPQLRIDLPRP